jgi:sirohydrochlorin ferrochelatase
VTPPLLAVAHGSRDPRSAATVRRLADAVRVQAPGLAVRTAFLDLNAPTVPAVLADLHAEGHREVTVVPLLLGSAYHARVDLPELIAGAAARTPGLAVNVADVLGADPLLQELALARVAAAEDLPMRRSLSVVERTTHWFDDAKLGVVLTGVGSSHAAANAAVARIAVGWQARGEFAAVTHAFATCEPSVAAAVTALHARGIRQVAVAPWFLAPGLLLDRVAAQARAVDPGVLVAEPLGSHPAVADVVLARYTAAATLAPAA